MPKIGQAAFTGGELDPSLHARIDLEKYFVGLAQCKNYIVQPQGGLVNRSGLKYITEVKDSSQAARLIPFKFNAADTYMLVFNAGTMRVIRNGGQVVLSGSPAAWADATGYTQVVHVAHGGVNYYALQGHTSSAANDEPGVGSNWTDYWWPLEDDIVEIPIPYTESQLPEIDFVQSADVVTLVHEDHAPRTLSRTDHDKWVLETITFQPDIGTPTGLSGSGGSGTSYSYKVTATADETLEEGLPSSAAANLENGGKLTWTDVSGAIKYNVYKAKNGIYGFIGTASDGTTGFTDSSLIPITDDTPPAAKNPFSGVGDYPSAVTYHEQRTAYGGSLNTPQGLWFSQTGAYNNFSVSEPAKDADGLTLRIITNQIAKIEYLVSVNDLLVLTAGADIKVSSGDNAFTLENVKRRVQGHRGSARIKPIQVGAAILFVQVGGNVVRDLQFSFESDSYTGGDLTVVARHLFRKYTLEGWDYQQDPYSTIWAVRSDGKMLGMTYLREHQILAWHQQETDGLFEDVAVVPESTEFATYVVVNRTIDGNTVRYVERLSDWTFDDADDIEDATFLDSHLTGTLTGTTISGLDHLEDEVVTALVDGNVYSGLTVASGSITLPRSYTNATICVGLPYVSQMMTLEPPIQGSFGHEKSTARLQVRVLNTRGIWAGPDEDSLVEYPTRQYEDYGVPNQPITDTIEIVIDPSWETNGQVVIQQPDPLPQNILAVMPDVEIGG